MGFLFGFLFGFFNRMIRILKIEPQWQIWCFRSFIKKSSTPLEMVLAFQTSPEQCLLSSFGCSFSLGSCSPGGTVLQLHDCNRFDTLILLYKWALQEKWCYTPPPAKQIAQIIWRVFILFLCVLSFSAGEHLCPIDRCFINFPLFISTKLVSKGVCTRKYISKELFLLLQPWVIH